MFTSRRRRESKRPAPTTSQLAALLFGAGEQGVLGAFDDWTKLFQDAGMTTPVTAVGQTVAKALDQSGRGNTITFSNAVLATDGAGHYGIQANGTSTSGVTASIDFTGTDKISICAGFSKTSDAAARMLLELGTNVSTVNGSVAILTPHTGAANTVQAISRGTTTQNAIATGLVAPLAVVSSMIADISAPLVSVDGNNGTVASTNTSQGTGNFANLPLNLLARSGGSLFFSGVLYALSFRGALSSAAQIAAAKAWANSKTGAF